MIGWYECTHPNSLKLNKVKLSKTAILKLYLIWTPARTLKHIYCSKDRPKTPVTPMIPLWQ